MVERKPEGALYLGVDGVNSSRLLGSAFGLGFGAFLTSLRPLSLLPMGARMTQNRLEVEGGCLSIGGWGASWVLEARRGEFRNLYERRIEKILGQRASPLRG